MLKLTQQQNGDCNLNWTNIRNNLKQDPFFTITNNIRLNREIIRKLEQENKAHTKNPPQQEDKVKEWICILWVLSDLAPDSAEIRKLNSVTALKLAKQINNAKYIKPSACRLVLYAFEGMDQDELLKDILCTQAKPGKFKQNILLCANALRIIYLNNGLFYEQATKFWFYSSLFNDNASALPSRLKEQTFEEIMKDIRIQAMHGLISAESKQRLLKCIQKENQIFMQDENKKVLIEEELKFVRSLFRNIDTSCEIEELIHWCFLDEKRLMTIIASNPSLDDCSRLLNAFPGLKSIATNHIENDDYEWGADIKQEKYVNEWQTALSYYYIRTIFQKLRQINNLPQFETLHSQLNENWNENEVMYFGYAIETLVDHFIQENELPLAIALLEEGVRVETIFVDNIYESSEKKHTILYKCGKYLEWCIKLHQDGKQKWTEELNGIEEKMKKFETVHSWDDEDSS